MFEFLSKTLDKDQLRHFLEKVHADENFVNNIGERITKKGGSKEARQLRLEQAVHSQLHNKVDLFTAQCKLS